MRFRTTRWDLVLNSGDVDSPQHCKALADFCSLYWYPIYSFARYKGFSEEDAEDLTQSFFLHLLEKTALKRAQPHRGRFRSFLELDGPFTMKSVPGLRNGPTDPGIAEFLRRPTLR
jgi:hypothetical protein